MSYTAEEQNRLRRCALGRGRARGEGVAAELGTLVRGYTERLRYRNKDKIWDGMYEAAEADPASLVWNAGGADEDIASFFRARFGDPGGGGAGRGCWRSAAAWATTPCAWPT